MMNYIQHIVYKGIPYLAVQWDGSFFPSDYEPFQEIGFFEDCNGYDLDSVDTDFVLEEGRKYGCVRQDDWVIKNSDGKFSHVSDFFFKENFQKISSSKDLQESINFLNFKSSDKGVK